MSNGASFDYKFGAKNNWRRTVWNEIRRRVKNAGESHIVYLAGEQALDNPVMASKGFDIRKAIAVERSGLVAKSLRDKGTLTIKGDIATVIKSWPISQPVDVLFADLCSNLTANVGYCMQNAAIAGGFSGAVVMFNIQRGRERPEAMEHIRAVQSQKKWIEHCEQKGISPKSRAYMGIAKIVAYISKIGDYHPQEVWAVLDPKVYEYRSSGNLVMDSVIWTNFYFPDDKESQDIARRTVDKFSTKAVTQSIIANRAVMTRRLS